MAHGITETDTVLLHKEQAWHKLGVVVKEAPTPHEAMALANLNWRVLTTNGVGGKIREPVFSDEWKLTIRQDTNEVLGCVSKNYTVIQNEVLMNYAHSLALESDLEVVESAGSLFGGRRIFCLLKAKEFDVEEDGKDTIVPYVLLSNSHDGTMSFSARTTSVRVVCNNTLTWAINGGRKNVIFSHRHTKNMMSNLPNALKSLKEFGKGRRQFSETCAELNSVKVRPNSDVSSNYFSSMWETLNGKVDPEDHTMAYARNCWILEVEAKYQQTLDRDKLEPTYWTAFNAVTEKIQHGGRNLGEDKNVYNRLFGSTEEKTNKVWAKTLQVAN